MLAQRLPSIKPIWMNVLCLLGCFRLHANVIIWQRIIYKYAVIVLHYLYYIIFTDNVIHSIEQL